MKKILILTVLQTCFLQGFAQSLALDNAVDPATMLTNTAIDLESYLYHNNSQFYAIRLGYFYGLKNERHLIGLSLPYVHSIFEGDYGGYENTTGIGDIKMSYLFVPFHNKNTLGGIERITMSLDVTAPTGDYQYGRGAGAWLYKPGAIVTWRLAPTVAFYPEVRYQFSGSEANSQGGSDGAPDPDDPEKDEKVQNLSFAFPATIQLEAWQGWFSLNVLYRRSFSEGTDFLFLRTDIGKIIGNKSCASLRITKFIAGQPRLNLVVQANLTFFMR